MGRRLQTVAAVTIMKILLMIFNLVFWVSGIIILGVGIWSISSMSGEAESYLQLGFSTDYYKLASHILIGTGSGIVVVGSLGCFCTVRGHSKLLYMYSVALSFIFIAEIGAAITGYKYRDNIRDNFKKGMLDAIKTYNFTPSTDRILDDMQQKVKCCGALNATTEYVTGARYGQIPQSCCISQPNCHPSVQKPSFIYREGCYTKIMRYVDDNLHIIAGTALGIAMFQVLGISLSCCLAKYINKATYERVN